MRPMRRLLALVGVLGLCACGDSGAPASEGADGGAREDSSAGPSDAASSDDSGTELGDVEVREEDGYRVVTFTTASFVIEPNQERYVCQNFKNPFSEDVAIVKSTSVMVAGSHHMFAFQIPAADDGPLEDCSGLEFGPAAHASQVPERTVEYPAGVARLHPASEGIRIQAHYLNVTDEPIVGNVKVTLYTRGTDGVELASALFFNNLAVSVPANATGFAEKTCTLPQDLWLMNAVSHMHQYGTRFRATTNDGTVLYETDDWAEPEERKFETPLRLPAGTAITFRCDYDNPTNAPLRFGESARTDEMCIFTGQFYPAPNGGIVCM